MRYLLDTHIFLWFINGDNKLSENLIETIENENNIVFVSFANLWEIIIKSNLGKLKIDLSIEELYKLFYKLNIKLLVPNQFDLEILQNLENLHKDPFDRMIIAQSIANELIIITEDSIFKKYQINML